MTLPARQSKALDHVRIDPTEPVPHYQQIEEQILAAIEIGKLARGDPLPSEREFAEALGVSRMTLRHALKDLQARGWLDSQVGKGWFVSPSKIEQRLSKLSGFSTDMQAINLKVRSRVLDFRARNVNALLADRMEIPIGSKVFRLERVRLVNDEPLGIEDSNVLATVCPELLNYDFARDSLYRVLREVYGVTLSTADQTVEASIAGWREASLLEINEGGPVIRGSRDVRDPSGRMIEASDAVYRGDRYKYRVRISVGTQAEGTVK